MMPLYSPSTVNGELLTSGEEVFSRRLINSVTASSSSGRVNLQYFTARKTETITQVRRATGSTAAAATPTICRMGIYQEDPSTKDLTLVASTTNDTALFAATNTVYTKALSSSWSKAAGTRYAFADIVVSGAALPTFTAAPVAGPAPTSTYLNSDPRVAAQLSGQSDLPASIAVGSLAAITIGGVFYSEMLP